MGDEDAVVGVQVHDRVEVLAVPGLAVALGEHPDRRRRESVAVVIRSSFRSASRSRIQAVCITDLQAVCQRERGHTLRRSFSRRLCFLSLARLERDEDRNPPRVRPLARPLLVRERVLHALHEARAARRDLLAVPPVLHGQAEAGRHRRPGRALPAPRRQARKAGSELASPTARSVRRPAAPSRDGAESERMPDGTPVAIARRAGRRPGGARGRDDARRLDLGGRRAATPEGEIEVTLRADRLLGQAPPAPARCR